MVRRARADPLGMGDEDGHSLRGEGELVHLDAHQFRAAEGPGEAKQDECPVPQGNDVIAEAVREKIQGLHENGRLPVLEGALFAPDGGHGGPHDALLGRVVPAKARGDMVFRYGGDAAGDGIGFGIVGQVADVVHDGFGRCWKEGLPMEAAPIHEIPPVAAVCLDGIVGLGLPHAALRLGGEAAVCLNVPLVPQQETILWVHLFSFFPIRNILVGRKNFLPTSIV